MSTCRVSGCLVAERWVQHVELFPTLCHLVSLAILHTCHPPTCRPTTPAISHTSPPPCAGVPGATASLPLQEAVVAWARETEAILREAELPEGCQFLNIAGFGHPTPLSVEYGSQDAPIGAAGDLSGLEGRFSECEGDGVVPLASAYGDGLKAAGRLTMKGTHRGLLEDPDVMRVVSDWLVCDGV